MESWLGRTHAGAALAFTARARWLVSKWRERMRVRSMPLSGWRAAGLIVLALPLCSGCVSSWWNSFLDPTQVGNFRQSGVINEIQKTISFSDKPSGIPNAVDPTPDDLIATVEEYTIGPGDVLEIRMLDFLAPDAEYEAVVTVDDLGFIDVSQLGVVPVEGMSVLDVREELVQRAQAAEIYSQDSEPSVTLTMLQQLHRTYNVSGEILRPNVYRIPRSDFRLREAINMAGSLDHQVKTVYVFRGAKRETRVRERVEPPPVPPLPGDEEEDAPAPPVMPGVVSAAVGGPAPAANEAGGVPRPTTRTGPSGGDTAPAEDRGERDLIDAVDPVTSAAAGGDSLGGAASTPTGAVPETSPSLPPYIFKYVNDEYRESPTATTQGATEAEKPARSPAPAPAPSEPVDWQELASEDQQRIIRIPADRLRNGDNSYNIVIRHQDWIRLDPGPIGFFYLGGHVGRPGTYSLTGEQMTLTQAIFSAGGFDALAWPTRCEIRRRIDHDREEITQWDLARIMEGKDPDLFIKPNDVVNVGTHAIAPLLATIRNSFRLTYGFGFVYDRNFADIDAYFGEGNPRARRRSQQQARFPGLFP